MKDIDFDELDRAVNSLMSGVPKAEPAKEDDIKSLAPQPAEHENESEPEQSASSEAATARAETPVSEERPAPRPSIAIVPPAARRGRFMDMVRPAASEERKPVPSRAVSRQGVALEPTSGFTRPTGSSVDGITPPSQPAPKQPDAAPPGDWPDPLAAVNFDSTTDAVAGKGPISSPFLPDAKVEKRPLGRTSDGDNLSESVPEPEHAPVLGALAASHGGIAEASAETSAATVPQQPLPAELGQDVMAIEADTSSAAEEPTESAADSKIPSAHPVAPAPARPAVTSIPQQYKVQPKLEEPATGNIYDTATYHQPLTHPAKKKPGWLWVLIIILILIVGAASGAALYFYALI